MVERAGVEGKAGREAMAGGRAGLEGGLAKPLQSPCEFGGKEN